MPLSNLFAPLARLFTGQPTAPRRDEGDQERTREACRRLALYQFHACPYCGRVRRAIANLDLEIEIRDIRRDASHRDGLVREGGSSQVPCLRIEEDDGTVRWLYESYDIVRYLERRFPTDR
ncbi:glutathione S-transferase N-terminal domain-containing protein [Endothiovibrio diazotrophicus]